MGSVKTKAVGPPWLVLLSKVQFYNPCDSHPSNMVNYYCTTCKGNALCKSCHGQHEGHRIIQVESKIPLKKRRRKGIPRRSHLF
ncbi:hypothetical protein L1049_023863 [Liquidambar formosana]|uniref:B box-type domain-containing protein n=1 Tax=Liquidambar formosana TaxID=63359 RepID=A0AAP0RZR4_LIQFO